MSRYLDLRLSRYVEDLLPTDEDVRFYHEHGWYVSKPLFSEAAIDDALDGARKFYLGEGDLEAPAGMREALNWTPAAKEGMRLNDFISFQSVQLRRLTLDLLLGAVAAKLASCSEIRLLNATLIYKPPEKAGSNTTVGWHADRAYWKSCSSMKMLTAWIPFHDCDETMGTLAMLDGSHRWGMSAELTDIRSDKSFFCGNLEGLERRISRLGLPVKRVPMNLKKGQVSFHHCLTLHGSGPNRSPVPRQSVAVHLQDGSNRYVPSRDSNGRKWKYKADDICRRNADDEPDYADPAVFPLLWSEAMEQQIH